LQSQHPTAIDHKAAFGPVILITPMFHLPPFASRQAQIQQNIETPSGSSNEPPISYSAINHPNQSTPNARSFYKKTLAFIMYPVAPSYKLFEPPAPHNPYFDPFSVLIPNKRLNSTKAASMLKGFNKNDQYTSNAYDFLNNKNRIFFSLCYYEKMRPSQFAAIFP
jgi:hypothetical protein